MAEKVLQTRIQLKYDTYANWVTNNPVLKAGEVAIVAVAVIGEEVVEFEEIVCEAVDAVATEIVSAKQLDAKKIELTFDAAISQAEAEKIELFLGDVAKSINKNFRSTCYTTEVDVVTRFNHFYSFVSANKFNIFIHGLIIKN